MSFSPWIYLMRILLIQFFHVTISIRHLKWLCVSKLVYMRFLFKTKESVFLICFYYHWIIFSICILIDAIEIIFKSLVNMHIWTVTIAICINVYYGFKISVMWFQNFPFNYICWEYRNYPGCHNVIFFQSYMEKSKIIDIYFFPPWITGRGSNLASYRPRLRLCHMLVCDFGKTNLSNPQFSYL